MATAKSSASAITTRLRGLECLQVLLDGKNRLAAHFDDGTVLFVEATSDGLIVKVESAEETEPQQLRPTKRQQEYLAFIGKYISRFGRSPAESDIQRHFLVSAPSVNSMMQNLEKNGFIARQRGVPRSAKLRPDLESLYLRARSRDDA